MSFISFTQPLTLVLLKTNLYLSVYTNLNPSSLQEILSLLSLTILSEVLLFEYRNTATYLSITFSELTED